ncbi:MAG: ArnT family glycosyltransferase [Candidatus Entotheonellia bacterium]
MATDKLYSRLMQDWPILFLIFLSLFLNLYAITWGLPNIDDWASLSLAPLKPLAYAKHFFYQEAWLYHYPPFHPLVLALAFAPYMLYLFVSGALVSPVDVYPYGLTNPLQSLTIFILIARCVSAVMGVGIVVAHYYSVKKFYDKTAAFGVGFFIATSYPIIHYSHTANVDVPQLLWFSLAIYAFISLIHTPKVKYYILLGIFTAFAFTTKESIYSIFIGVAIVILIRHLHETYQSTANMKMALTSVFDRKILYPIIAFFIIALLIFNPITNWDGFFYHVARHSLRSVRGSWVIRDASSKVLGHLELVYDYMLYMSQSNGLLIFLVMLAGFIYAVVIDPKKALLLMIPIISYYIFFLRIHGTHHLRYMLPAYLLLLWFAAKLCGDMWNTQTRFKIITRSLLCIIFASSLVYGFSANLAYSNDCRYDVEKWISQNIESGSIVLGLEPGYSLPRFPKNIIVLNRNLMDFDGNIIDDMRDVNADYIVLGMSIPRRQQKREEIRELFQKTGYQELKSFATKLPWWAPRIPNIHSLYSEIMILKK